MLRENIKIKFGVIAALLALCFGSGCYEKSIIEKELPPYQVVFTDSISLIGSSEATIIYNVNKKFQPLPSQQGIVYSTSPNPELDKSFSVKQSSGYGRFDCKLTGLSKKTKYFVRAFAKNIEKIEYGNELNFTTLSIVIPAVTTYSISSLTTITAQSGGIVAVGESNIINNKGLCWSTLPNPTILNSKTSHGGGGGAFTSSMTGLNPGTRYYVRAYASYSQGTAYGNEFSFSTLNSNVTDIDGNIYKVVQIGKQVWMRDNLKTLRYRNGDPIPSLNWNDWSIATSGAYSIYNNAVENDDIYGKLYNFYAVADTRGLCPIGWHIPSTTEWTELQSFLGGDSIAGGKLKTDSNHWSSPNVGASNQSGFTALPGGQRSKKAPWVVEYSALNEAGFWWSITTRNFIDAYSFRLYSFGKNSYLGYDGKQNGISVRCIKD